MDIKPPPRLVALDTQVFDGGNFNYTSKSFKTIVELVKQNRVKILLTSVTLQEIRSHITEGARLASEAVDRSIKELKRGRFKPKNEERRMKISANSNLLDEFEELLNQKKPDFDQINQELQGQLEDFILQSEAEIIEVDKVQAPDVFKRYFSTSPPFGSGKKKSEFPDAFVLLALEIEAQQRGRKIYAISGDKDWEMFCDSSTDLSAIKSLDNLLEDVVRDTNIHEVDKCLELYQDKYWDIEYAVKDKFPDYNFSIDLSEVGLIEWGSEMIDVEVDWVDFIESSLIFIDDTDDPLVVTFESKVEVTYTAQVQYESLEDAIYDKEDDVYFGSKSVEKTVTQSLELDVEVIVTFRRDKNYELCEATINDIDIDPNSNLDEIVIETGY